MTEALLMPISYDFAMHIVHSEVIFYITQQDSVLRKVDERLKVTQNGQTLLDIPLIKVSQVVLYGRVTVTAATVATLVEPGVGLCYLSEQGRYIGRLEPHFSKNSLLRADQWRAAFDEQRKLAIARQFVQGKLETVRVMLLRANREQDSPALTRAIDGLKDALRRARECHDLDVLRGHEGEGSAAYFAVFGHLIKQDLSFPGRVRRPPTDPANALLSFGYTLLYNDLHSACNVVGFDAYVGYLHADRYGQANLALDLMEAFRPLVVDSVVLPCLNKRIIQNDLKFRHKDSRPSTPWLESGLPHLPPPWRGRILVGGSHALAAPHPHLPPRRGEGVIRLICTSRAEPCGPCPTSGKGRRAGWNPHPGKLSSG